MNGTVHPPRFDPARSNGTLMDSEHRGRYHWATQLVGGRSVLDAGCGTGYGTDLLARAGAGKVTGLDLDGGALETARQHYAGAGIEFVQGDLGQLELPEDSFDLAICVETIEHLSDPSRGIAELRRVVRPGGLLVISSPNPGVYPQGNPHHVHELPPAELLELVEGHFDHAALFLQHAWLASLIESAETGNGESAGGRHATKTRFRRTTRRDPEEATFTLVIGSDGDFEPPAALLSLGDPFEVRWWEEQVGLAARTSRNGSGNGGDPAAEEADWLHELDTEAGDRLQEAEAALASMIARLECQERDAARALRAVEERERQLELRLADTGKALLDANQELAEVPLLKHRLAELYGENAALEAFGNALLGSRSWRLTSPLRRLRAFFKLSR